MNSITKTADLLDGTLILELHEKSILKIELLKELINDVAILVKKSNAFSDEEIIEYFKKLFFIYDKLKNYIIAHFDSNDLFEILDLDVDYDIYIERFKFSLEMLLKKDYIQLSNYVDELGKIIE